MSQLKLITKPEPTAEKSVLDKFLYLLAALAMGVSSLLLLALGFFHLVSQIPPPYRVEYSYAPEPIPGVLTNLFGIWFVTALVLLVLNFLDIRRPRPFSLSRRLKVGAAILAAMTLTGIIYYGVTVAPGDWRLYRQQNVFEPTPQDKNTSFTF